MCKLVKGAHGSGVDGCRFLGGKVIIELHMHTLLMRAKGVAHAEAGSNSITDTVDRIGKSWIFGIAHRAYTLGAVVVS